MEKWRQDEEQKAADLHVIDVRSEEEKAAEAVVQKMLEAENA